MAGTLTVDEALIARTSRDTIRYTLSRPLMIVVWTFVALSLVSFAVVAILDTVRFAELWWLCLVLLIVTSSLILLTVLPIRRSVRTGMPLDSQISASVEDGMLKVDAAQGRSEIRLDSLKTARIFGETLIVQLKGSPTAHALPHRLLSAEELAALGAR